MEIFAEQQEKDLRTDVQNRQVALYSAYQKEQSTDSLANALFESQQSYRAFIDQLEVDYPDYHRLKYEEINVPNLHDIQKALKN